MSKTLKKQAGKTTTTTPVPYRIDYKKDTRVKFTRRSGEVLTGRVVKMDLTGQTGAFVVIEVGTKDKPKQVLARPSKVKAY